MKQLLMEEPFIWLKGAIIFIIGPLDLHLAYLMLAASVDLMFGIQVAFRHREFSWGILISKFGKKLRIYVLWLIMFHAFDMVAGLPDTARWSLVVLLTGMEVLSSIKNTSKLGYGRLADALENLYLSLFRHRGGDYHERHSKRYSIDEELEHGEIEVHIEVKSNDSDSV